MHVEATPHLHDILVVHLFNAGLPCMASARALDTTRPVASVTHWLPCETVDCSPVGQGWYMGGSGLERVWNGMERGLERNGPLQHSTATTQHIFIKIRSLERE